MRFPLALLLAASTVANTILAHSAPRAPAPPRPSALDIQRRLDANRVNMVVTNFGTFAFDLTTGGAGLVFPRGGNQTAVFASGLWLGSASGGAIAEYASEYAPGAIVGGLPDDPNRADSKVYKVVRFTGDPRDTAHVDRTPAELAADPFLDPLAHHAWSEYMTGAAPFGAPTRVYRLPLTLTPDPNDSVDPCCMGIARP